MHNSLPGNYYITLGQTSGYLDMHFCPLTCIDLCKHSKIKSNLITIVLESLLPSVPDVYLPLSMVEFLPNN